MSFSQSLFVSIVITISLVAFSGCRLSRSAASDARTTPGDAGVVREARVGSPAPKFELAKLDGTKVSFSDIEGSPAVLVFWTAWCPSCREEAPIINKLAEKYDGQGFRVLGINIGEGEARVKEGIKDFGIKYDVLRDADTSVAKSYSVVGTPTIVFLDKNGVTRYTGNELPADYEARLDAIAAEN